MPWRLFVSRHDGKSEKEKVRRKNGAARGARHRTRRDLGNGAFRESDIEGKTVGVTASELGSKRVSIARVDGNAARVAGASTRQCE